MVARGTRGIAGGVSQNSVGQALELWFGDLLWFDFDLFLILLFAWDSVYLATQLGIELYVLL